MADATFALQIKADKGSYQTLKEATTAASGLAQFTIQKSGKYRIVETAGPLGYDTIPGNYEFEVDPYGTIEYDGKNVEHAAVWTLTHSNQIKPFDLTVLKQTDTGQSLKGAAFRLSGSAEQIELPSDETAIDTFVFEDLKPGNYTLEEIKTPEGHVGLKRTSANCYPRGWRSDNSWRTNRSALTKWEQKQPIAISGYQSGVALSAGDRRHGRTWHHC